MHEVWAEPDTGQHIMSLMLSTFDAEDIFDGKRTYSGRHEPGMINLVRAGQRPRAIIRGPHRGMHFYIPTGLISSLAEAEGLKAGEIELVDPACTLDRMIQRIGFDVLGEMRAPQPLSRLRLDALGLELGVQLIRRWSNLSKSPAFAPAAAHGGLAPHVLRRVTDLMRERMGESLTLCDLAATADLSEFHLCRAFKQSTGVTPHQWLTAVRMSNAQHLLAFTRVTITEIALELGYGSHSAFGVAFRRVTGMTPRQYREAIHL